MSSLSSPIGSPLSSAIRGVLVKAGEAHRLVGGDSGGDPTFSNVALLLPLDGANGSTSFTDLSSSPKTVTPSGNAQISTAQSKFGGASLSLDGNGDFLTATGFTGWNIRTTPFTVECFAKRVPAGNQFFMCGAASLVDLTQPNAQVLYFGSVGGTLYLGDGSTNNIATASFISDSVFQHVALTFDGTTYRVLFDGALIASSTTLLKNASIAAVQIGARSQEGHFHQGWLDSYRIKVGEALYTSAFTPPSEPFPTS